MKIEISQFEDIKYIIRYPKGYSAKQKYPIIIFLHGAGSRGDDINILSDNPYFKITDKHSDFPFISIAPQCFANTWFDIFEQLKRLICKIAGEDFADAERIYLMGASMGGYASWQAAMSMPDMFAAVVPICGGGMYWNAPRLINTPIWAFHGAKDPVVKVEESIKMVDAVNNSGGNARVTVYPDNLHDAWSDTYNNEEVFKWLLGNKNENVKTITDIYKNSKIYG